MFNWVDVTFILAFVSLAENTSPGVKGRKSKYPEKAPEEENDMYLKQ